MPRTSDPWDLDDQGLVNHGEVDSLAPAGESPDFESMTPLEIVRWIDAHPLVTPEQGAAWRGEAEAARTEWDARAERQAVLWSTSTRTS